MTVSSCFAPVFSSTLANIAEILRRSFLFPLYLLTMVDATREVLMDDAGDARQGRSGREHKFNYAAVCHIRCLQQPRLSTCGYV